MRNLLIKLVLRLLGEPPLVKVDEDTKVWLTEQYLDPRFHKYVGVRDTKIARELAGGVGLVEADRQQYTRMMGQRFENALLLRRAKEAHDIIQKSKPKEKK